MFLSQWHFQILTANEYHDKENISKNVSLTVWTTFVQLSSKINTLTLTLRGGRPFKISLTEPFLMCSTAASIEDKKNLYKNETCSIKTDQETITTITTWISLCLLSSQFDHNNKALISLRFDLKFRVSQCYRWRLCLVALAVRLSST